jgi:GTP-binding protein
MPFVGCRSFAAEKDLPVQEAPPLEKIRNVAIIAHVDHGKTTLVDQLLKQSGMGLKVTERMMDSKDLEQERGITILSKATRVTWEGYLLNIVDTPGHADFGGEVERVLSMVDGVVLLVDMVEGPKAQTNFVLQKALAHPEMKPIVVVNKVDRPSQRADGEIENEIFDLFASLNASDDQMDYPTLYASGKAGYAATTLEKALSEDRPTNMMALFQAIVEAVPPPMLRPVDEKVLKADEQGQGFSMLVSQLDQLPGGLGPTVTGKVMSGKVKKGDKVSAKTMTGEIVGSGKVKDVTVVQGVTRQSNKHGAMPGDIVSVSCAGFTPKWTQTLVSHKDIPAIQCSPIDPPVLSVRASVNDSPFAGKDGKHMTLLAIGDRLHKEALSNPAIEVIEGEGRKYFEVRGRGELQLGILLEEMRREGFEMSLSPPSVVMIAGENGETLEPWELIGIDVDNEDSGALMEKMATRNSNLVDMQTIGNRTRMRFECATRAFLGMRSWLRDATGGTAVVTSELMAPRVASPPSAKDRNGVIVANSDGTATSVDLAKAAKFGKIFIAEGTDVYTGMIVGEHNKAGDHNTSVARKHDGYEKAKDAAPPVQMTLEQCLTFLASDEKLEVTPKRLQLRKEVLCPNQRKLLDRKASKM